MVEAGKPRQIKLTRREQQQLAISWEELADISTPDEELEDITRLVFETTKHLQGL